MLTNNYRSKATELYPRSGMVVFKSISSLEGVVGNAHPTGCLSLSEKLGRSFRIAAGAIASNGQVDAP